jgi:hypothetical protein
MQKIVISIDEIEPRIESWYDIGVVSDDIIISINFIDANGTKTSIPTDTSIYDLMRFIKNIIHEKHCEELIGTPSADFFGSFFIGDLGNSYAREIENIRLIILRPDCKYLKVENPTYHWVSLPFLGFVSAVEQFIEDLKVEMEKRKDPKLAEKDKIGYERFMKKWNETLELVKEWKQRHNL